MNSVASIKDRLKNKAVTSGKTMQEMLVAYGLEGTVRRISASRYADDFTLKGGIFLYALFGGNYPRATSDIDLLAKTIPNEEAIIRKIFTEIFSIETGDMLRFDCGNITVASIMEDNRYRGIKVSASAYLDRTKIPVSIDIGFGDVIFPRRQKGCFPSVLGDGKTDIYMYTPETMIAEKFEAIVSRGYDNSRLKDFYDVYILAQETDFEGEVLTEALKKTFDSRKTMFKEIAAFEQDFKDDPLRITRWNAFVKKKKAMRTVSFALTMDMIERFIKPVISAITEEIPLKKHWNCKTQQWE